MAANTKPRFPASLKSVLTELTDASGTSLVTICQAGPEGTRVDAIYCVSTSASDKEISLYQNDGNGDFFLGKTSIPGNSSIELLDSCISSLVSKTGGKYLPAGHSLKVVLNTSLASGEKVTIVVDGGDY